MKAFPIFVTVVASLSCSILPAQSISGPIRQMEASGDTEGARAALQREVEANPSSVPALTSYAEFLERYGDPAARTAYSKLLTALRASGDKTSEGAIAKRLAILDLLASDGNAVSRDLDSYRMATGKVLKVAAAAQSAPDTGTATIPGPLRSFARMAAISPDADPEDHPSGAGAQHRHQRLSGLPQQRCAGADRVPQAGAPLPFAGARAGKAGRRGSGHQSRELRRRRTWRSCSACWDSACAAGADRKWCWRP